jgi:hypothetical protein
LLLTCPGIYIYIYIYTYLLQYRSVDWLFGLHLIEHHRICPILVNSIQFYQSCLGSNYDLFIIITSTNILFNSVIYIFYRFDSYLVQFTDLIWAYLYGLVHL